MPALPPAEDPTPSQRAELIAMLPEPCALIDNEGRLYEANAAWHDVFFNTGIGMELVAACVALFRWDATNWTGLSSELAMLRAGELSQVQFEAQIAEPPERWAVGTIAATPDGAGYVWQLTDVTRWQLAEDESLRIFKQFRDAVDSISDGFAIYDAEDRLVLCNRRYREIYPHGSAAMIPGRSFEDIVRAGALGGEYPEAAGLIEEFVAQRVAIHKALITSEHQLGGGRWVRAVNRRTSEGGIVSILTDITDEKQAIELRRQSDLQDEILRAQEALLAELSTPILQIAEGALAVPLIGAIDSNRAQRVVEGLLGAIEAQRAELVILDITGVPLVDTQVANVLVQCARAVRLLGARLVLTGIRPDVAQTIIALGIDLGDISTRADLRAGIRFALTGR